MSNSESHQLTFVVVLFSSLLQRASNIETMKCFTQPTIQTPKCTGGTVMNSISRLLIISLVLLLACHPAHAQWMQMGSPFGEQIRSVGFLGSISFAGTLGKGVYRSTNYGTKWSPVDSGLANLYIRSFAVYQSSLLVGTSGGIFVSSDSGMNWSSSSVGITSDSVNVIEVQGTNIYAGTFGGGVFCSSDGGSSWQPRISGLTNLKIRALTITDSSFYLGTYGGGVFISHDSGATWNQLSNGSLTTVGSPITQVYCLSVVGNRLIAGSGGGMFVSTDNGNSWHRPISAINVGSTYSLLLAGGNLIAGTSNGLWVSSDSGNSWTKVDNALSGNQVNAIASNGTATLAGTSFAGVFRSMDQGSSWTAVNNGFSSSFINTLLFYNNRLFASTEGLGLYVSPDGGTTWTPSGAGITTPNIQSLAAFGSTMYAGSDAGVFVSTDTAKSWTPINNGLFQPFFRVNMLGMYDSTLFAATAGGLFLSTNRGTNWAAANNVFLRSGVYSLAQNDSGIYAGCAIGVYRSTDKGGNWAAFNNGMPVGNSTPLNVFALTADAFAVCAATDSGVYVRSTEASVWNRPLLGTSNGLASAEILVQGVILVATQNSVFRSTDHGNTWMDVGAGLPGAAIWAFAQNDTTLIAATFGSGIWELWQRPLSQFVLVEGVAKPEIPNQFRLSQNYPNPFNPSTTIRYQIPEASKVTIRVYNLLGQNIATLVNEQKNAGDYSVEWNAENVPSGVYFYRTEAVSASKRFVDVKKMILLK
jgi:photosystem II stability/assembly factor-like uncharacterized protein